ncbi:hypothetical protein H6G97_36530 [Nostoc flagelliforme FACHB-838]|uniref:Bacterial surface antigen (D15) domain-containing protein n=2 Tax=Nostoc flagelliforme TaxID=1306274 RepID=A0ABR8E0P4_9NOSO|nr:hypothetical protein [Nostoc flagelliforme FACHB-838]
MYPINRWVVILSSCMATIATLGLGSRWLITPDLSLHLDYGIPLISVGDRGNSLQENGLYFSVRYQPF